MGVFPETRGIVCACVINSQSWMVLCSRRDVNLYKAMLLKRLDKFSRTVSHTTRYMLRKRLAVIVMVAAV